MTRRMDIPKGTCRDCKRRRAVFACSHKTGGNYRTAQRSYSSSICGECATDRLRSAHPDQPGAWSIDTVRDIVATLDTDEAREAVAAWDTKVEQKRLASKAHEEAARPYWDRIRERNEAIAWIRAQARVESMDIRTCQVLAGGVKRGDAGYENTGVIYEPDQPNRWERTMREQILDYLSDSDHAYLDSATIAALADGIRDGLHRPAPTTPPKVQDLP